MSPNPHPRINKKKKKKKKNQHKKGNEKLSEQTYGRANGLMNKQINKYKTNKWIQYNVVQLSKLRNLDDCTYGLKQVKGKLHATRNVTV